MEFSRIALWRGQLNAYGLRLRERGTCNFRIKTDGNMLQIDRMSRSAGSLKVCGKAVKKPRMDRRKMTVLALDTAELKLEKITS